MTPKTAGAIILILWTVSRVYFSARSGPKRVVVEAMSLRRRLLLSTVSVSLVPIYLYYFTGLLDAYGFGLPIAVRWLGVALLGVSLVLFVWSHWALGQNWTVAVSIAEGQSLVTSGPFTYVRHPMYAALILMGIALAPATSNLVASLPYLATIAALYLERVADEERLMLEVYGDEYQRYMRKTGRLLPRITRRPQ